MVRVNIGNKYRSLESYHEDNNEQIRRCAMSPKKKGGDETGELRLRAGVRELKLITGRRSIRYIQLPIPLGRGIGGG